MIPGTSELRWGRLTRRLVRDAIHWSDAVAGRLGANEPALRGRLAAEAIGLAACMVGNRLRQSNAHADQITAVARQLHQAWAAAAARGGYSPTTNSVALFHSDSMADTHGSASVQSLVAGGERLLLDQRQAAVEFQRVTGLGSGALVNDGHNLAALIFYHRVFLAARGHPAFTPVHRAEIVKAAQQCRERFERMLRRAPPMDEPSRPILGPMVSLQLPSPSLD